ncbi:MAG: VirB3 family type IV secretion system protein [Candidatus Accumulibacter sp.]|jgi:type IV secretory pathway VirB3-like protein|nr:VirB3 family type IV secretion system protein [Accumulibacter sp.]
MNDPLFKGCTRPATYFGVPVMPLAVVSCAVILLAVWTSLFVAVALVPAILVMRAITAKDDQQFRLLWLKFWCRGLPHANRNAGFWKASAYAPVDFKKR